MELEKVVRSWLNLPAKEIDSVVIEKIRGILERALAPVPEEPMLRIYTYGPEGEQVTLVPNPHYHNET